MLYICIHIRVRRTSIWRQCVASPPHRKRGVRCPARKHGFGESEGFTLNSVCISAHGPWGRRRVRVRGDAVGVRAGRGGGGWGPFASKPYLAPVNPS